MRFFVPSIALALALASTSAFASVTEPNGLSVPVDSNNGEIQLYTMFQQLGEPIDWKADAASSPSTFSPLCGFSAKFVLHQAGSNLGLAWYNDDGQPPVPHVIVPAGSPVGTLITSSDIKNDPAYKGGLVGFALVGNQTHYSDPKWDPQCTFGCNPNGPWITAMIYASKKTPEAYYVAFEDGDVGGSFFQFNNDGDFNDDVYFLTGLTCAGGGTPCDSGKPGICGPGITQCTVNGITCVGVTPAAPMETCNGLDDDCNGMTDEGDICPAGSVCDKGSCVQACGNGEFTCTADKVCNADGYCVDPACKTVSCPAGQVCLAGVCKGPCDGVVCPFPDVCRVGACVDPCAGVMCDMGQLCDGGACVQPCSCAPCAAGKTCDKSGACLEPACVGKACAAGTHCVAGGCVDDCAGAACPSGEACMLGACVPGPMMTTSATGASGTVGAGGSSFVGVGVGGGTGSGGGGGHGGAGGDDSSSGAGGIGIKPGGPCGCHLEDRGRDSGLAWLGAGLALIAAARRRRAG